MPSVADHIALANKNHVVLSLLLSQPPSTYSGEWIATVAFYKAVQVTEAIFATRNKHSRSHDSRIDMLRSIEYGDLFLCFRPLYEASLVARYLIDSGPTTLNRIDSKPSVRAKEYHSFDDYMPPHRCRNLVFQRLDQFEQESASLIPEVNRKQLSRVQALKAVTG